MSDTFTCINNWNPTTTRTIASDAFTTAQSTTCPCTTGFYVNNYICTPCDIGYYCTGGVKTACPVGYTTATTGSIDSSYCILPPCSITLTTGNIIIIT